MKSIAKELLSERGLGQDLALRDATKEVSTARHSFNALKGKAELRDAIATATAQPKNKAPMNKWLTGTKLFSIIAITDVMNVLVTNACLGP
jgi:hypothetical protein